MIGGKRGLMMRSHQPEGGKGGGRSPHSRGSEDDGERFDRQGPPRHSGPSHCPGLMLASELGWPLRAGQSPHLAVAKRVCSLPYPPQIISLYTMERGVVPGEE